MNYFTKKEIIAYNDELLKLNKEINEYREANKIATVRRKEKRIKEIEFILDSIDVQDRLDNARKIIIDYKTRYGNYDRN